MHAREKQVLTEWLTNGTAADHNVIHRRSTAMQVMPNAAPKTPRSRLSAQDSKAWLATADALALPPEDERFADEDESKDAVELFPRSGDGVEAPAGALKQARLSAWGTPLSSAPSAVPPYDFGAPEPQRSTFSCRHELTRCCAGCKALCQQLRSMCEALGRWLQLVCVAFRSWMPPKRQALRRCCRCPKQCEPLRRWMLRPLSIALIAGSCFGLLLTVGLLVWLEWWPDSPGPPPQPPPAAPPPMSPPGYCCRAVCRSGVDVLCDAMCSASSNWTELCAVGAI